MIWYCLMSHLLVCMGGLQVNVEKSKMMISGEETWKVRKKGNFFCAVFRKIIGSSSFLGQFCKYWCNGVGGRLKLHYEFNCGICASQETDTGKELVSHVLWKIFVILLAQLKREGVKLTVFLPRIKNIWRKLRNLALITSRGLPLEAKVSLYSGCVFSIYTKWEKTMW